MCMRANRRVRRAGIRNFAPLHLSVSQVTGWYDYQPPLAAAPAARSRSARAQKEAVHRALHERVRAPGRRKGCRRLGTMGSTGRALRARLGMRSSTATRVVIRYITWLVPIMTPALLCSLCCPPSVSSALLSPARSALTGGLANSDRSGDCARGSKGGGGNDLRLCRWS